MVQTRVNNFSSVNHFFRKQWF